MKLLLFHYGPPDPNTGGNIQVNYKLRFHCGKLAVSKVVFDNETFKSVVVI